MADCLPCCEMQDFEIKGCESMGPIPLTVSIPASPGSWRPPSEDSDARLELVGESLQRLSSQVRRQEDLQLAQHQQMVRFQSTLQDLEDRSSGLGPSALARLQAMERKQSAMAAGAQRAMQLAMKAAEAQQTLSDRQDEMHGRSIHELRLWSARVEQLEQELHHLKDEVEKLSKPKVESPWASRVDQQEATLKRLEQRIKHLEAEDWHNPVSELKKQIEACSKGLDSQISTQARAEESVQEQQQQLEKTKEELVSLIANHDKKLEAFDVAVGELQASAAAVLIESAEKDSEPDWSGLEGDMAKMGEQIHRLEEQVTKIGPRLDEQALSLSAGNATAEGLHDLRQRLEDLTEMLDGERLTQLRHVSIAWPELNAKLERVSRQSAECCAKTEAFEVRLDLTRRNLDTQERRLEGLTSRVTALRDERHERRVRSEGLEEKSSMAMLAQKQLPAHKHFDIKALATKQLELKKEELVKKSRGAWPVHFGDRFRSVGHLYKWYTVPSRQRHPEHRTLDQALDDNIPWQGPLNFMMYTMKCTMFCYVSC
ncbi:unnamed protein product [Durusdinium trenchii]|uniref:Uncharacterized protein n=1 Tax=Durusdinium trenchii TaxID=1381693 RepID=A0ABP0PGX9_9DINO